MTRIMILIVCSLVLLARLGWSMRSDASKCRIPNLPFGRSSVPTPSKDMTDPLSPDGSRRRYHQLHHRRTEVCGMAGVRARHARGVFLGDQLEIPIHELKVWTKGNLAWFTMELDYIRFVGEDGPNGKLVLPLRETGVLEQRAGQWVLLSWHESPDMQLERLLGHQRATTAPHHLVKYKFRDAART